MLRNLLYALALISSHEAYRNPLTVRFSEIYNNREEKQIQPLSCKGSNESGKEGICMFAWNCVEVGGVHLGTCIDRFYFGSCCQIPSKFSFHKESSSISSTSMSTVSQTSSSSSSSPSSSSSSFQILPVEETTALSTSTNGPESTFILESLTSFPYFDTTVSSFSSTETINETIYQEATSSTTSLRPELIDIQSNEITDDIHKPNILETTTSTTTTTTIKEIDVDEFDKEPTNMENILEELKNMDYKEICGRRPWLSVKDHEKIYSNGVKNGPSTAPIGSKPWDERNNWKPLSFVRSGRRNFFDRDSSSRKGRIVNGDAADYGEWPWQVSLRQWRTATYLHKCGCALLNENWAITAAHCVENVSPDDLSLRMGEYDLNSVDEPQGFMDRKVQVVASHPKFDPKTFEYDLALLRFYEPVTFQPNIIPICVPEDDRQLIDETAWVTGWGRLYEDGPLPSVMQEVDLPIINNSRCEEMYRDAGYVEHIPDIFICAGYAAGGKDSCEGDSGGPMVVQREDGRFMLSGVISWGIGCAEKNQPGVYTRISEFRSWIQQILEF